MPSPIPGYAEDRAVETIVVHAGEHVREVMRDADDGGPKPFGKAGAVIVRVGIAGNGLRMQIIERGQAFDRLGKRHSRFGAAKINENRHAGGRPSLIDGRQDLRDVSAEIPIRIAARIGSTLDQ